MMIAALWLTVSSLHAVPAATLAPAKAETAANADVSQTTSGSLAQETAKRTPQKYTVYQLTDLVVQKQYLELDAALKTSPDIPAASRAFFEGVLANRENRITDSLRELELALADTAVPVAGNLQTIGFRTLADDYVKSFRYGDAADAYARLLKRKDSSLTDADRKDIDGSRQAMESLRNAPPQTVVFHSAFMISTKKNALGLAEVPVTVGGHAESWILDTGANMTLVTSSVAHRMGLTLSQETAPLAGLAGKVVSAHTAVIPELRIGTAVFRNVAVLVVDDKDFYVPEAKFQFQGILGYPALSALGSATLYNAGGFGARIPPASDKLRGSQMMMEELTPLVAVKIGNARRLFLLDTGTNRTYLTERYLQEHTSEFAGQPTHNMGIGAAGGSITVPAYTARSMAITAGGVQVTLKDVSILSKPAGTGADYFYGTLGQDVLNMFKSCSLDFRYMRYICTLNAAASKSGADRDDD
jgi:hypothetical protein